MTHSLSVTGPFALDLEQDLAAQHDILLKLGEPWRDWICIYTDKGFAGTSTEAALGSIRHSRQCGAGP